jgi:O-acetyl-ADP-ribose deacetylase (regulator of RNase III)/uncharacterized protein YwgA
MSVVKVTQGDLFESGAQTLVNTVNTVGVMGKGIALQFKKRFPLMYEDYRVRCARDELELGKPYLFAPLTPPWVVNFPTKGHWRSPSKLDDIERGLRHLTDHADDWGIESLAVPPLGCGNGELEWRVAGPVIYQYLDRLRIPVIMFAPFGTPLVELEPEYLTDQLQLIQDHPEEIPEFRVPAGAVALVEVLARLQGNPVGPRIGRILFHKLGYFGIQTGLPFEASFVQRDYGPFSQDFKDITRRLINNSLIDEEPSGQMMEVRVGPAYEHARGNYQQQLALWSEEIDRLVDLFSRMDTRNAEIAATVHFTAQELLSKRGRATELEVFSAVNEWKPEKFTRDEVAQAIRHLGMSRWLPLTLSRKLPVPEPIPLRGPASAA